MRDRAGLAFGVLFSVAVTTAHAGQVEIGGSRSAVSGPLYYSDPSPDDAGASHSIYPKAALAALPPDVPITGIEFDKRIDPAGVTGGTFTVYLKNSSATSLSTEPLSDAKAGATMVYTTSSLSVPAADGWFALTFATPFVYTGDTLEVITEWDLGSGARASSVWWGVEDASAGVQTYNYGPDALVGSTVLGPTNTRPNLRIDFTTPSAGWLVVRAGDTSIVDGATYQNHDTFANADPKVEQELTVTNTGGAAIALGTGTITDATNSEVTILSAPASVAPGASGTIVLEHKATAAAGTASYTVNLPSDAPNQPFTYTLTGAIQAPHPEIGMALVNSEGLVTRVGNSGQIHLGYLAIGVAHMFRVRIGNTASGPLTLSGATPVAIQGSTNAVVAITTQPAATVEAGKDVYADLTITVSAAGAAETTVRIANDDATESDSSFVIKAIGIVAAPPKFPDIDLVHTSAGLHLTPGGSHSATLQQFGDFAGVAYSIGNTGEADLNVGTITISNFVNCTATVRRPTSSVIPPGGTNGFEIEVAITDATKDASYVMTVSSDDPDVEGVFTVTATIPSAAPNITVTTYNTDRFIQDGLTFMISVLIQNDGNAPLTVSSMATSQPFNVNTMLDATASGPATIAPGADNLRFITATMLPLERDEDERSYTFVLTVNSNDRETPKLDRTITGTLRGQGKKGGGCSVGASDPSWFAAALILLALAMRSRRATSRTPRP